MWKTISNCIVFVLSFIVAFVVTRSCQERNSDAYIYGVQEGARWSYQQLPMFECAWCHRTKRLNRHHIIPQSADKSLRDVPENLVVLCRTCHECLGHRGNWKHFNPDVVEIVTKYTNDVISAEWKEK